MKVLVCGTFDHFHAGHRSLLLQGAARGDLYVIVARDRHVEEIKGRKPDQSEDDRMKAVQGAAPKAIIILGDSDNFLIPVWAIAPDLILLGYDQKLPPGVSLTDLPCPVERAEAFKPETYKSSLRKPQSSMESS